MVLKQIFTRQSNCVAGLDISPSGVRCLALSHHKSDYIIEAYQHLPLATDAIVEYELKQLTAISQTVKQIVQQSEREILSVAVAIPDNLVISRTLKLDRSLTEAEQLAMVTLEAEQIIPYPMDELFLDFQPLPLDCDDPELIEVQLVAVRRDAALAYQSVINEAGLELECLDVASNAKQRAVNWQLRNGDYPHHDQAVALFCINTDALECMITHRNRVVFLREESWEPSSETEYMIEVMQRILGIYLSTHHSAAISNILLAGEAIDDDWILGVIEQLPMYSVHKAAPLLGMKLNPAVDGDLIHQSCTQLMLCSGLALREFIL